MTITKKHMTEQRPKILAIDDTPVNLITLTGMLKDDFEVQTAHSGAAGLTLAAKILPDLILLDVMMPEMDGYETCRRLKADARLKNIPVIFVTALTEEEAESTGLSLGAADFITKPINIGIARQRIRNLLEREQLRKEIETHRDYLEQLVRARTAALFIAKDAAEAASRAKTTFLANMSHELLTPMNGILGMTELALRKATDPKQTDHLNKVLQSGRQMVDMVNNVLDIARLESERLALEPTDFRLGAVVSEMAQIFERKAKAKNLAFSVDISPELDGKIVHGDPARLAQVLRDLVGNAVKFTSEGSISVVIKPVTESPESLHVRFEVADTGIGISSNDQAEIFTAFHQVDGSMTRRHGGTGLGLAICKHLVALMGGSIGVSSQRKLGSTFWFTCTLGISPAVAA